jgi:Concanavalin A-like lectin/glucanases superfamily
MKWRIALAVVLAALFSFAALQALLAQFNGCTAGFCSPTSGTVSSATNSLIFTSASSQYLSQTGKTGINQQKFTFACWFKAVIGGANQTLLDLSDGTTNNRVEYTVNPAAGTLNFTAATGGTTIGALTPNALSINDGAWHHALFGVDTTQATAASRLTLYVDGALISSFSVATYPSQNANLSNNFAATYDVGSRNAASRFYNGKLAQIYYVDGQQLTPPSFITGTPGVPKAYSGTYIGTFDFFLSFSNGTSTTTLGADGSGEGNNWTLNAMTTANQSTDHP